jgi:hypothetical protein
MSPRARKTDGIPSKQRVGGSNPSRDATKLNDLLPKLERHS